MSLRTYFLRSEFNLWRARIRKTWNDIKFSFTRRPLKSRIREFAKKYLFLGIFARWSREKQATTNTNRWLAEIRRRQDLCSHRKGQRFFNMTGSPRPLVYHEDYNVSLHTFIDNRRRVICNICKRIWWEGDAGWDKALYMAKNYSSNKPSSSEVPGAVLRGEFPWQSQNQRTKSLYWTRTLNLLKMLFRRG